MAGRPATPGRLAFPDTFVLADALQQVKANTAMKLTLASRPPGPWDSNAPPAPSDAPTRNVNQPKAPSPDAAFGDRNQAARNAAARVDAEAEHASRYHAVSTRRGFTPAVRLAPR